MSKKSKRNRHTGRVNHATQCLIDAATKRKRVGTSKSGVQYAWGPDHVSKERHDDAIPRIVSRGTVVRL